MKQLAHMTSQSHLNEVIYEPLTGVQSYVIYNGQLIITMKKCQNTLLGIFYSVFILVLSSYACQIVLIRE